MCEKTQEGEVEKVRQQGRIKCVVKNKMKKDEEKIKERKESVENMPRSYLSGGLIKYRNVAFLSSKLSFMKFTRIF